MHGSFKIFSRVDGKTDGDEIISILTDVSKGRRKNDLKLVNYYHEMPISYGMVEIYDCSGGVLELTVHQNQTVVVAHQRQTILKSDHFPDGLSVHAIAENVNIRKSYVMLGRFAYATLRADRREAVRVSVDENVPVTIKTDSAKFRGTMVDISVSGIKVKDSGLTSDPGAVVIEISVSGETLILPGVFRRESINENGHFHVFTLNPDAHAETVISKMLYVRQVEIIQMLKDQILTD